jgi:hypothetical protein
MGGRNRDKSLVSTWINTQQKVLSGWLDLLELGERPSRAAAWNETVKAWQTAVEETLEAQARWLRDWTTRVQVSSGSPTQLRKSVQQAQVLLLRWTEAQQQLWQCWFDLVLQLGPVLETGFQTDEHLLQTLRERGQAIIDAQAEWVRRWTTDLGI